MECSGPSGGNWLDVAQTVGILGGLFVSAWAINREAKAREIEALLVIAEQHRALWSELLNDPDLRRILQADANVLSKALTQKEEEGVNLVIMQFMKSWRVSRSGGLITLGELAADVRHFFALPLPQAFWEKTKQYRNPKFVKFVERAIERRGR